MIHHHFVTVHNIRHRHASKLVRALMNHADPSVPVFQPDEYILRDK